MFLLGEEADASHRLDFGRGVGQPIPEKLARIAGWQERVASRPSAAGSLHPLADSLGMRG